MTSDDIRRIILIRIADLGHAIAAWADARTDEELAEL